MSTTTVQDKHKVLTLRWNGVKLEVKSRTPSYSLRRQLRRIEREFEKTQARNALDLPEGLTSEDVLTRARALKGMAGDEEKIDETWNIITRINDLPDCVVLEMACAIANTDKINLGDPIGDQIREGVYDEDGEVSEFWASQDWEDVVAFVEHFRQSLG